MTDNNIRLCDYVVAFVDLLGQKAEMPDRHLPSDEAQALSLVKKSVGRIVATQNLFESFYKSYSSTSGLYSNLPKEVQRLAPDLAPGVLKKQVFSDGMVIYIPLGKGAVKSPVNSIFGLLVASGMLCATGLAGEAPLRIGIDVAWAVEYRPGELYGSALAHAYQLESQIAKWPRVVIGEGLLGYLQHYVDNSEEGMSGRYRREMASICLGLLSSDVDGQQFLDYLGENFNKAAPGAMTNNLIYKAKKYIESQLAFWEAQEDRVLADRYYTVRNYYKNY